VKRWAVVLLAWGGVSALAGTAALAGHPFGTEDAGTQGKGNAEVEFNWERVHGADGTRTASLGNAVTMGIAPRADLAVTYAYDFTREADGTRSRAMGPVEVALKAALLEGRDHLPAVGVKAGLSLPVEAGEQAALLVRAIAEWSVGRLKLFANAGADVGTHLAGNEDATTLLSASAAGAFDAGRGWWLLSELLWGKQRSPSLASTAEWLAGVRKEITETFTLDAGARWGLTHEAPHVTWLAGMTLGFRGQPGASAGAGAR